MERHLALRSTCTTDGHRNESCCRWNSLRTNTDCSWFHQESRPSSCRFLPVPRRPPSNLCAMTSMTLSTAFRITLSRSLLLSPSRVCSCQHVTSPDASQPTTISPLPCVVHVVIRIADRWQATSGLSLEPLQTRRPLFFGAQGHRTCRRGVVIRAPRWRIRLSRVLVAAQCLQVKNTEE